jgi:hypothetical protein
MLKLHRLNKAENVNDEWNNINNVVAYIISEGFMGFDTIIGYVYINENNKLRREWCGWL